MNRRLFVGLLAATLSGAAALAAEAETKANNVDTTKAAAPAAKEVAVIKTTAGEMTLEFWSDVAPNTVENFKKLARQGFYDGTCFHRIIKGFMIQGGDPKTKDASKEAEWGTGDPGYKIKAEFNDRKHIRGVISMARAAHPDSAGCQFFICLDAAPSLDNKYTAFGKLIKGEDVLVKIGDTPVGPSRSGERSKPLQRVSVESIKVVPAPAP
jgi:peptidyl-prolyl cis-trans isomerase B (cyclophilin B)